MSGGTAAGVNRPLPWMEIVGSVLTAGGLILALLPPSWGVRRVSYGESGLLLYTAYRAALPCLLIGVSVLGAVARKRHVDGIFLTLAAGLSTLLLFKGSLEACLAVLLPLLAWAGLFLFRRDSRNDGSRASKASRILVIIAVWIPLSLLILGAVAIVVWLLTDFRLVH